MTAAPVRRFGDDGGMDVASLLLELYGRVPPLVRSAVDGLDPAELTAAVRPGTNTIAWLVWHLTRVEDHHLAEARGDDQTWVGGGWAARFGFERADPQEHGYGHTPEQVAALRPDSADALVEYHDAVWARAESYLRTRTSADLDRIVDDRFDPPVSLGVRLVSVADDALQHAGQAAFLRGLLRP